MPLVKFRRSQDRFERDKWGRFSHSGFLAKRLAKPKRLPPRVHGRFTRTERGLLSRLLGG